MRSLLVSRGFTVAAFAVASLSLVALLYGFVQPFSHYGRHFGLWFVGVGPFGLVGVGGLLGGLAAATLSCVLDAERRSKTLLHRFDYFFVLVVVVCAWSLTTGFFEKGRGLPFFHLVGFLVLALTGCSWWATTVVRLRAGTLVETVLWPRVLKTLPLNQFSGIFILAVVAIAGLLLLFGARSVMLTAIGASTYSDLNLTDWLWQWGASVAMPALTLAVVAVLSINILSITAAKERAVEERLREERFRAELITNVTHDLRTPLTSIVSYADLIGKLEIDDPTLAEYSAVLGRKAERLRGLIGDLLEASRASAGTLPVTLEPIELTEILGQVAGDFDDALTARGLTWVGPAPGHVLARADGEHLWRILENLVGNVTKYARPESCVHADIVRAPGVVSVRLSNVTAEPVPLSAEELTAQFVRGDASRHSEGSGLGLFIADRLARLMGAALTVAVDGDRFSATVSLPEAVSSPVAQPFALQRA